MKLCIASIYVEDGIHETEVYKDISEFFTIYNHMSEESCYSFVSEGESFKYDTSDVERFKLVEDDSSLAAALEGSCRDDAQENSWFWKEDTSPILFFG
ncbi:hypothetical protein [uncultured Enterococcus sp.]|uniref:hypothetical protein n=1 Tax=uncultured Enterococcus sp. TaxID=167972 RepID=UPI002AA5EBC9|nr:hypothetical protein [uncultured Enterococcus sp.]